jgi:phosphosulfolactate phosphohydrolase-like enzyme
MSTTNGTDARPDVEWMLNDGALAAVALGRAFPDPAALFPETAAGRGITEAGLEPDLEFCAEMDRHDVLPILADRQLTLLTPSAAVSED